MQRCGCVCAPAVQAYHFQQHAAARCWRRLKGDSGVAGIQTRQKRAACVRKLTWLGGSCCCVHQRETIDCCGILVWEERDCGCGQVPLVLTRWKPLQINSEVARLAQSGISDSPHRNAPVISTQPPAYVWDPFHAPMMFRP